MKDLELDAAFLALKGEVVEYDIYHLRDVADVVSVNDPSFVHWAGHSRGFNFEPTVIFDFGANIGLFTKYARDLFPKAKIVSVEPDPDNFERLLQTIDGDSNCEALNVAIGKGTIYRSLGAANGSGECYLSRSVGFGGIAGSGLQVTDIKAYSIFEIITAWADPETDKILIKIDIEGGENSIFDHELSKEILRMCDYVCMEVHWFGLTSKDVETVKEKTLEFFESFRPTHNVTIDNCYFYATKK